MIEFLQTLLGKKVHINVVDESLEFGTYTLCELKDNGLLCKDKAGKIVLVNVDYIVSVKEVESKVKN